MARVVLNEVFDAEVKGMLAKLKWSNVTNLHREALVINLRKLIMTKHSIKAHSYINLQPAPYLTRYRELKLTWTVNTDSRYGKASFLVSATKVYNEVRFYAEKDKSQGIFKSKVRERLWSKYQNDNIRNNKKPILISK